MAKVLAYNDLGKVDAAIDTGDVYPKLRLLIGDTEVFVPLADGSFLEVTRAKVRRDIKEGKL